MAAHVGIAAVSGLDWFGRKVEPCNVLYVSAEDPKGEIHFRFKQITQHLAVTEEQQARFKFIDLADNEDSALVLFDKNGQLKLQPLFNELEKEAREHSAGCIVFDASADLFGGDESARREVRAFIGLLRRLAMRLDAAVVLIAHPSVDGIKTGRGYSGSTHWNNAVRSRLYFTKPETKDGVPPNPDLRMLELAKSNRARAGEQIHMTWWDGGFIPASPGASRNPQHEAKDEELFLQLLATVTRQGLNVSLNTRSHNYAPAILAKLPGSKETGKAALECAMLRLIEKEKVRNEEYGPPSRKHSRLVAVGPVQAERAQPDSSTGDDDAPEPSQR